MPGLIPWGHDLATVVDRFADAVAVSAAGEECRFAELGHRAAAVARHLHSLGVTPGEPVASFLRNGVTAVWTSYGITLAGAAETPLDPHLTPAEIAYVQRLTGFRHVITDEAAAPTLRALGIAPLIAAEIADAAADLDPRAAAPGESWGRIILTSGTTGRPKAIVHSHERRWLATLQLRANLPIAPEPGMRILLMTPYPHGSSLLAYAFHAGGAAAHLVDGVRLDEVGPLLESGGVDCVFAPPTVLMKLTTAFSGRRFPAIRAVFCGTQTLTPEIYRRARDLFGPVIRVTYGKSEVFNPITVLQPPECEAFYAQGASEGASLGWPASGVEVEIRDEAGRPCPPGVAGTIHLRARHQMIGQIDEAGFHPLAAEDFHDTGDEGLLTPSRSLIFLGRRHDVIKSGGYKIHPQDVEVAVADAVRPGIAVAIGLPSAYWGEVVVVAAEGAPEGWEARAALAAERLAKPKRPRAFLSVAALPRGRQEKLLRRGLVELLLAQYRLEDGPHPRLVPR